MTDSLERLRVEIEGCTRCDLSRSRNRAIFGEGNPQASVMLIGEAPGAREDQEGRPFIGRSGQLLDQILAACGFSRKQQVFISNIVRCRPPGNRTPTRAEVEACRAYLRRQITLIDPKILVLLGATALRNLFQNERLKITQVHGQWLDREGRLVMPVYHPAALLRNPGLKRDTWEAFKQVVARYRQLVDADHYSPHC